jgi:RHS repeat-associated protein
MVFKFSADRFRKGCRDRFPSHLVAPQAPRKNSQTCFEGPFGEVIRATGPMAKANALRFSTKYQDDETDLLYYGYRYYNAGTGRWLSRDRLGEATGPNIYECAHNQLVNLFDLLGECASCTCNSAKVGKPGPISVSPHYPLFDIGVSLPKTFDITAADRKDCKCYAYDDGEFSYGTPLNRPVKYDPKTPKEIPECNDKDDVPGAINMMTLPPGELWNGQKQKFHFHYKMTLRITCQGTDGSFKEDKGGVEGDYWFYVEFKPDRTISLTPATPDK